MAARWEQDNRRKRVDRRLSARTAVDRSVDLAPMARYTINVTLVTAYMHRLTLTDQVSLLAEQRRTSKAIGHTHQ